MADYSFLGHYEHTLDSKNRVAIPAKFCQQIPGGKVIVTRNWDQCLVVYPEAEWQKLVEHRLSSLDPVGDRQSLKIERMLYASATECEVDRQGRIGLSAYQLKQAGIGKEVVFKGLNNKFEIWDPDRWETWEKAEFEEDGQEA